MYMYKGIKTRIAIYNVCLSCLLFTYGVYGAITHVYQHIVTQYTQVKTPIIVRFLEHVIYVM